ncbi:hypothetical protein QEG98_33805 [Myxococcus sp. MxC21-1]|uniref:hypothetical protein n=1 Tax=Myxococcus sp. MxC21-1 TaxID=3041439 RepID=UPI002930A6D1|nr:hypothetical protein [Myxococcus sp. MxC21-1]WNZ60863.1 hypothetical protein QEG98_33805 [Myxococcus sp. MxC21-1]
MLVLVAGFVYGARGDRELQQKKSELLAEGVRCWGRILGIAPRGDSTTINGRRWMGVLITVEAYAAVDPRGVQPHAVGTRVADQVVIGAEVSELQFALMIPGYF